MPGFVIYTLAHRVKPTDRTPSVVTNKVLLVRWSWRKFKSKRNQSKSEVFFISVLYVFLYLQCLRFHLLPQRTVKLLLGQATHRSDNYFFLPWYAKRNRTVLWFQIVPRKEERATMQEIQGKKGKYDSDETLLNFTIFQLWSVHYGSIWSVCV